MSSNEDESISFEKGEIVQFAGYGEEVAEADIVLQTDQLCMVDRVGTDDMGNAVYDLLPVDEDLKQTGADGDQAFTEEIRKWQAPEPEVSAEAQQELSAEEVEEGQVSAEVSPEPLLDSEEQEGASGPPPAAMEFEHDPQVVEMIRGSNDLEALARDLHDRQQEMNYFIGGVITEIHRNKLHVQVGKPDTSDGFAEYVAETIGPERRKCYMLMSIYRTFRERGLTAEALSGIGWTKAVLLTRADPELMAELLPEARNMTREEIADRVEGHSATTDGAETISRTTYKFTLYGDANSHAQQALDWAKSQIEETDPKRMESAAFEFLCTQIVTLVIDAPEGGEIIMSAEQLQQTAEASGLDITVNGAVEGNTASQ